MYVEVAETEDGGRWVNVGGGIRRGLGGKDGWGDRREAVVVDENDKEEDVGR